MKKLVLLFALCAFYCADFNAQQVGSRFGSSIELVSESDGLKKAIYIKFGRKSKDCRGFGICIFEITLTVEDAITLITAILQKNRVHVSFPPKFVAENAEHFKDNKIVIEEDFVLDDNTARALGVKSYVIKKGVYPVVLNKGTNTYNCTF